MSGAGVTGSGDLAATGALPKVRPRKETASDQTVEAVGSRDSAPTKIPHLLWFGNTPDLAGGGKSCLGRRQAAPALPTVRHP